MTAYGGTGSVCCAATADAQGKRAFIEKNPDIDYHLYDEGNLVGCIHIIPLRHEAIMEFLGGGVNAWLMDTDSIEQFEPGKSIECLLLDALTDPEVEPIKRSAYAAYMIAKLARRLAEMGSQGVEITKAYGASRTPSGIRVLKSAGFRTLEERANGAITFELDLMSSKEKILKGHQDALQEWKSSQNASDKSRRKYRA